MTFTNASGRDDLIIAGDGLWHVPASSLGPSNAPCKNLVDSPAFKSIKDLDVSRVNIKGKPCLSIWVANIENAISYLRFDGLDVSAVANAKPVEVIPEGNGGYFSSFMDEFGNQSLVYSTQDGKPAMLEQAVETGMWEPKPFIVYVDGLKNEIINAYLCTMSITDTISDLPVANASVHVSPTAWLNLSANGKSCYLTPDGLGLEADSSGRMAFLIPTSDISSTILTIKGVKKPTKEGMVDLEIAPGQSEIDPSHQTIQELGRVQSAEQLKNAQTPYGESMFADSNISDGDFHKAAGAFGTLIDRHASLASGTASITCTTS